MSSSSPSFSDHGEMKQDTKMGRWCISRLVFPPVLRIRIRMFLGLLDPDPLVPGTDSGTNPAPDPSIIKQKRKKKLNSYCFVTFCITFFLVVILKITDENTRIRIRIQNRIRASIRGSGSGSLPKCHGSATPLSSMVNGGGCFSHVNFMNNGSLNCKNRFQGENV
jgi:hypothetical protein